MKIGQFFFSTGDTYEDAARHNAVFVGRGESGIPRYAHSNGPAGSFRLDVKSSDKAYSFGERYEDEKAPKTDRVKETGNTTVGIHVHFNETSCEAFTDKGIRLIGTTPQPLKGR